MATDRPEDRDGALVELKLRSDGVSVLAKAFDANGKPVDLPARVVFYPQYFTPCEIVRLGTVEVFSVNGEKRHSVFRAAMDVPGRTGTLRMPRIEEEGAVMPFFMGDRVPPQGPPAAESAGDGEG